MPGARSCGATGPASIVAMASLSSPARSAAGSPRQALDQRLGRISRYVSWELVLALVIQFAMLVPILRTPFINDDQFNSNFVGLLHHLKMSMWDYDNGQIHLWITQNGRFFPVSTYIGYLGWYLIHGVLLYKWALIVSSLAASASVWWLLRELRVSRAMAALVLIVIAGATQYRYYLDPHFSFNALTQGVMIELSVSLICFQRWLTRGSPWWLAGSMVLAAISASTYEAVYLFAPLFIFLAIRERRGFQQIARASIGPVVLMIVFLVLASYLRDKAVNGSTGPYAPGHDPREFIYTFVDQFLGGIPLTYAYFDPSSLYTTTRLISGGLHDVVLGIATFGVTFLLLMRARWERWSALQTGAIGLALWLIVAATSALARRYQQELVAGWANVTVYFEEIGFAVFAASVIALAVRAVPERLRPTWGRPALSIVLALAAGILVTAQHHANRAVVSAMQPLRETRALEDQAMNAGLLRDVPNNSAMYLTEDQAYRDAGYYWMHARRDVTVPRLTLVAPAGPEKPPGPDCSLGARGGSSVLQVSLMPGQIRTGLAAVGCIKPSARTAVYLRNVSAHTWLAGTSFSGEPFLAPYSTFLRREGKLWRPRDPAMIDVRTLALQPPPSGMSFPAYLPGCFGDEGNARWCGPKFQLHVVGGHAGQEAVVRFIIQGAGDNDAHLRVSGGGKTRTYITQVGTVVRTRVKLGPLGSAALRLTYDGKRFQAPPGDARALFVRLENMSITPR
jgi:hypothetical protein